LSEGVGIATNNVAEYRAVILGLKHALKKGYKHIRVRGDSKLVCMQVCLFFFHIHHLLSTYLISTILNMLPLEGERERERERERESMPKMKADSDYKKKVGGGDPLQNKS
jgi:ribonuclease HI